MLVEDRDQELGNLADWLLKLFREVFVEVLNHSLHVVYQACEFLPVVRLGLLERCHVALNSPLKDLKPDFLINRSLAHQLRNYVVQSCEFTVGEASHLWFLLIECNYLVATIH